MISLVIYSRIVGIVLIALGCLFLTKKRIIINQRYFIMFSYTTIFGGIAIDQFGGNTINPIWTNNYLLILAALYLFLGIISFFTIRGRYTIINVKIEAVMPVITKLLDKKGITYEVIDNSVVLTNYENKKINCEDVLNSTQINFRDIIRLPVYDNVKDSLLTKVKLIKETIFPSMGVLFIMLGTILIVITQIEVTSIR